MLEAIQDYCLFHRLSIDISYFAKVWSVKLDNQHFSTGIVHGFDLADAFNQAKKIHEKNKK